MIAIFIVFGLMMGFICFEKIFPRYNLPYKKGWVTRAIIFNFVQVIVVIVGSFTWEHLILAYFDQKSFFKLIDKGYTPFIGGLIAYFVNTWIFYWWHRARHEVNWMWLVFHQLHHSPERLETITSFYKHPLEIFANSLIMSTLMYPILGLNLEANLYLSVFSAIGEFFYHMNVKTPYWIGFFIQRPESHRLHHLRDKKFCVNYSDLPLWDILGGTFENPKEDVCNTGFSNDKETDIMGILTFKDVVNPKKSINVTKPIVLKNVLLYSILILGCLSSIGYVFNAPTIRNIGYTTVASPLPLVFSVFNGVETFSTKYDVTIKFNNNVSITTDLDNTLYSRLHGPYNRRNMYGVTMSHGIFFDKTNMIKIRDQILHNGICTHTTFDKITPDKATNVIAQELGYVDPVSSVTIKVRSKTVGFEEAVWSLIVDCTS